MNTIPSTPGLSDVQQVLASAVAHHIERMTKDEVQALVAQAHLDLQNENAALKERVEQLERDKLKLLYQVSRNLFSEKDWEDFNPSDYTVPVEDMLADMDRLLKESGEISRG